MFIYWLRCITCNIWIPKRPSTSVPLARAFGSGSGSAFGSAFDSGFGLCHVFWLRLWLAHLKQKEMYHQHGEKNLIAHLISSHEQNEEEIER